MLLKNISDLSSLLIENLWDAPKALLIQELLKTTQKNILIITGGERENRLLDNLAFFGVNPVYEFPAWETLPQEEIPPSPDIVGKRFEVLYQLLQPGTPHVVLCPLQAALQKVLPPEELRKVCQLWKKGDQISFQELPHLLTRLGYRRASVAADKGEFALRGGICDVFPLSSPDPYRLDFFGDILEEIRIYDPISQKSVGKADQVFLSPAEEMDLLKRHPKQAFLLDYLGKNSCVVFDDLLALEDHFVHLKLDIQPLLKTASSLPTWYWLSQRAEELSEVRMRKRTGRAFYTGAEPVQELSFEMFGKEITTHRWHHPFMEIADYFSPLDNQAAGSGEEILSGLRRFSSSPLDLRLIFSTDSEEKHFLETLKNQNISLPKKTTLLRGYLASGFVLADAQIAYLPMTELTKRYRTRRQKWRSTYHTPASEFHELSPGDIVVHFQNGIGKYQGLEKKKNHLGQEGEFLVIEYAESSKLYVPVAQSHLVSRYIGVHEEVPTLSTLGTQRWQKQRLHAQKAIIGYAQEMLRFHAEREVQGGFAFPADGEDMRSFEADFPFQETEDQLLAVAAIKQDMMSSKAMDRLICGDVGYGKTEVAMRAAFKAVADGKKQVAVLVPTTVLALQHYETFCERMANFPINLGVVSRFRSLRENRETIKKVQEGAIDILIGTHRMVSEDVIFHDLGLLIIDEEQRFGVRAKEHLKKRKVGVDCLTLSATPIPRTLYLALMGGKEISVINTPPQDRLPIKSHIVEREPSLMQNALLREFSRDGQALFIHNRVETIFLVADELQKLIPEARIVVGHGQMSSDEIDTVFHAFKKGDADLLVATTIVENGIDIPNANTIFIDRADQFGLADLYQLRGRVGRWNRPAYAYFLVPQKRTLPELVLKRLGALVESSGYGGGMKIALRDLEIRGAGDILGIQQSGQIASIGFHLYCKLLKRTIDALKRKAPPSFIETKMEFPYDAALPNSYIAETNVRLEIYHRLGEATSDADTDALLAELKDRFGPPPPPVLWLYHLTRIRLFASQRHYTLLKFSTHTLSTERQKGDNLEKKTLPLPPIKKPADLETLLRGYL